MKPHLVRRRMALIPLLAIALASGGRALAQTAAHGAIRGYVVDSDIDLPNAEVRITIVGTTLGAVSSAEGAFLIENVPAGVHTLSFSKPGFDRVVRTDVVVTRGQLQDVGRIDMSAEITDMPELIVAAEDLLAGTEIDLIEIRADSLAMQDSVSAELIASAGAGDVAGALGLVTGASVADGKYATVRGLSDRYTGTTLNGVRVPSADPRRKAVQVDLFPTGIVESVTVTKTFTPDLQGDFTGGGVDIRTKSVPDGPFLDFSFGGESDEMATNNPNFLSYKGGGVSASGFGGKQRDLPEPALNPQFTKEYATIKFFRNNATNINPDDIEAARQYDEFTRSFAPAMGASKDEKGLGHGFSVSGGNRIEVPRGVIGVIGALTYSHKYKFYENGRNNRGLVTNDTGPVNLLLREDTRGTDELLLGVLGTIDYKHGENHDYALTLIGNQGAEDEARIQTIRRSETSEEFNQTLKYTERSLASGQLRGKHRYAYRNLAGKATSPLEVDWFAAYNFTRQDEPDVRFFRNGATLSDLDNDGVFDRVFFDADPPGAPTSTERERTRRIFQRVYEEGLQGSLSIALPFTQWSGREGRVKLGAYVERADREFRKRGFYWRFPTASRFAPGGPTTDELIAVICNQRTIRGISDDLSVSWTDFFSDPDRIGIAGPYSNDCIGLGTAPQVPNPAANQLLWTLVQDFDEDVDYRGNQDVTALYSMVELPLSARVKFIGGFRKETTDLAVNPTGSLNIVVTAGEARTTRAASPEEARTVLHDASVLPAATLIYEIVPQMSLRGAWSKTLARPTFRELAPVLNEEFIFGDVFLGNPNLILPKITNYDLRWEWFRRPGEVLAVSAFFKKITDPIEQINFSLSTGSETAFTTPENFERGEVKGFEIEGRSSLDFIWKGFKDLAVGANYALLDSSLDVPLSEQAQLTSVGLNQEQRPLFGQPEYTFNANLTFDHAATGTMVGVFYNEIGDTLFSGAAVGGDGTPNIFEIGYETLDVTFNQRLAAFRGNELSVSIKARNLTGPLRQRVYRLPEQRFEDDGTPLPVDVTKSEYRTGASYSVSMAFKF